MNRLLSSFSLITLFTLFCMSQQAWSLDCTSYNITLSTQAEVNSFQTTYGGGGICDRVAGSLIVQGNDIANLDGLAKLINVKNLLIEVNGILANLDGLANLTTVEQRLSIQSNPLLSDVDGLHNLTSVGETLVITTNDILVDVDGLANLTYLGGSLLLEENDVLSDIVGLANIASVGGNLSIDNNPFLTNIDGLTGMTSVGGSLTIYYNHNLTNIDGLANLATVGSSLLIYNNATLTNINGLSKLTGVLESLRISNNATLKNIDGLSGVSGLADQMEIFGNAVLTNIDGLSKFTNVGGHLGIYDNAILKNVNGLARLVSVGSTLYIQDNDSLADINGLSSVTSVGGELYLNRNTKLSRCSALAGLLGWPDGPPNDNVDYAISVDNNADGCNSVDEIIASVSGPTAPVITSSEAINWHATLSFIHATTSDAVWPISGYQAQCLSDEQFVFQNNTAIEIPDLSSVDSSLPLSGVPFRNEAGLNIEVNITHPRTRHLTLTLVSPNGISIKLWDEAVGDGENLIGTFPKTLEPAESLSAFDGLDFNGEWKLIVADGVATQTGTLNSWGITVQDKVSASSKDSPVILISLANNHTYSCQVSAVTGLGIGPPSNEVSMTPVGPDDAFFHINNGLNDAWYYQVTTGQGFFITVFPQLGYISLSWFTYDTVRPDGSVTASLGEPGHRWLNAVGPLTGNLAVLDVSYATGGLFDSPTPVEEVSDGTIILTFSDCNNGTVEYDIPSIGQQGTVPIQRVVSDNITLCESLSQQSETLQNSTMQKMGKPTDLQSADPYASEEALVLTAMNPGLNDAWYYPVTTGQGFFINVFPVLGYVTLSWFTYDTERPDGSVTANLGEPGHRWLNALGQINGNQAAMDISYATGGLFDSPTPIEEINDGTITLTFTGCNSGTVEYDIPSINRQGVVPIQRVANDNIALCEALNSN